MVLSLDQVRDIMREEVPKWISVAQQVPWPDIRKRAKELWKVLQKPGHNRQIIEGHRDALEALAQGLAIAAFDKDGVEHLGVRYEATHIVNPSIQ